MIGMQTMGINQPILTEINGVEDKVKKLTLMMIVIIIIIINQKQTC